MSANPLLDSTQFPAFDKIKAAHILPALDQVLDDSRAEIDKLLASDATPSWEKLITPLEEIGDRLDQLWAPVSHLNSVKDSPELREAYEQALPKLSAYSTELGQNQDLYQAYLALQASTPSDEQTNSFSPAQKMLLEQELRDFKLSGVALNDEDKARYKALRERLSQLTNTFSRNVLDATEAWSLMIEDEAELEGLPESVIASAAQAASEAGETGWKFTLHAPSSIPFMTHAAHRKHREAMYTASSTRASDQGPNAGEWDNSPLMSEILALRTEMAELVGFDNYAHYSLASKMVESPEEVESFLLTLADKSKRAARADLQDIIDLAQARDGIEPQAWDLPYYSELIRQQRFDFSEEELRPYFPLPTVLKGLFKVVNQLFGIEVVSASQPATWHPDVQFFRIVDEQQQLRGYFYLDLFARKGKQGGAWMADCTGRRLTANGVQSPTAFLTCNFSPPLGDTPSLLRHDDVVTLFHEFGHGLHHMLTQVDVAGVAGINGVPWDAVELPSQFLENWCWQRDGLDLISGHFESGEALPDALLDKMLAAKNFQSGMQMLRQIEFSLFDLRLHQLDKSAVGDRIDVQAVLDQVRNEVAVVQPPAFNRFAQSFSHIFAGGYAAGYYSYKWAEVLSADAFSRFEEEGIMNAEVGQDFLHHILEKGGSEPPQTLFQRFRGRAPTHDALLRHSGLLE